MPAFTPGLDLARAFHLEVIAPTLADALPALVYSSALVGYGSDVLRLDTERSMDHNWRPRGWVFLPEDGFERTGLRVRSALRAGVPRTFRGFPTDFTLPTPGDRTRVMRSEERDEIDPFIEVSTWEAFVGELLGKRRSRAPTLQDWLTFPEQSLLELTAGEVFQDGLGTLTPDRERFAYFPRDVWLHRMSSSWQFIAQEEPFVGRAAEVGDEIGSRAIEDDQIRALPSLLGAVDQLVEISSAVQSPILTGRMRGLYGE